MEVGIAIIVLIVVMVIGVPVPFAFLASSAYLIFACGYDPSFLIPYGYSQMDSVILLAIPLFIMAGGIMDKGGIGGKLVGTVQKFVGGIKGGLGVVTVVSCAIFGAVSGSAAATLSCIGTIMAPRLKENGYSAGFAASLIASSSILGILIPPSLTMILYSWIGNQSVLATFLAGAVPGIILMIFLSVINLIVARKDPNIKLISNKMTSDEVGVPHKREVGPMPALLMPIIILGSIYGGILTPTEAAAVSVFYAIPVGLYIYKDLNAKVIKETIVKSAVTTGVIMIMLFSVMILSRMYVMENLPQKILTILTSVSDNRIIILIMINIFMIILGMLMDDVSAVLLATPILLPVVTSIGVSPIHFAGILVVNIGIGCITPPTAPLLYLGGRIANAEVKDMLKSTMLLILCAWLPTLILVTFVPQISTFLPDLLLGLK